MTEKANPDFSKTAINLCNPQVVKVLLQRLADEQTIRNVVTESLKDNPLYQRLTDLNLLIAQLQDEIRTAIDKYGSYQDVVAGNYGLAYIRRSVTYRPRDIKEKFPKYAGAIIEETVNKATLEALIKAGVVDADLASTCADVKETKAYVIK